MRNTIKYGQKYKVKIRNIFRTWHPDFIEDATEPRGYKILSTGRWVVEWTIVSNISVIPCGKKYCRANFESLDDALAFERRLHDSLDDSGYTCLDYSNW